MKKQITSVVLGLLFGVLLRAAVTPSGKVTLAWDYPASELSTNLTFRVYSSATMQLPITAWPVLTNVVGTNLSVQVTVAPGQRFFFLTASNFWGESGPSNLANTPPLPRDMTNLTINRTD
jgi:hypothetical protein